MIRPGRRDGCNLVQEVFPVEDDEKPQQLRAFLSGLLGDPAAKGLGVKARRFSSGLYGFGHR